MPKKPMLTRRVKIDKANSVTLGVIAFASFITIFSIFSSKALISQYFYQSKVIKAQNLSLSQVNSDNQAATSLISSYTSFANQTNNIIGGSATGTGSQDGTNGRIILDALPDAYDFPALATSIVKVLSNQGVVITGITGSDTSSGTLTTPAVSGAAVPIAIPFGFTVTGTYSSDQNVLNALQDSIRPIQIVSMTFSGSDGDLTMSVLAQTYYQLPAGLNISSETIQ